MHAWVPHAWLVGGFGPAPEQSPSATTVDETCSKHTTVRVCVPPPHSAEQVPNALGCHTYTGHGCVLQACEVAGFTPAHEASGASRLRLSRHTTVRVCVPPPQVAEHVLNGPVWNEKVRAGSMVLLGTHAWFTHWLVAPQLTPFAMSMLPDELMNEVQEV